MTSPPLAGLKALRERYGIHQADIASMIDVTQSHYCKLEAGTVRLDIYRAARLAKRLQCTIDELL
jgi:transcriptional regulator with XRE-family HTH domain